MEGSCASCDGKWLCCRYTTETATQNCDCRDLTSDEPERQTRIRVVEVPQVDRSRRG